MPQKPDIPDMWNMTPETLVEQYARAGGPKGLFYDMETMLGFLHRHEAQLDNAIRQREMKKNTPPNEIRSQHIKILDILDRRKSMTTDEILQMMAFQVTKTVLLNRIRQLKSLGFVVTHRRKDRHMVCTITMDAYTALGDQENYIRKGV